MNKSIVRKEMDFAGRKLSFETGELAEQANLAVKVTYGDTVVLATVVSGPVNPELGYFPLSVAYEERLFAAGLIKTSRFVKRSGRPNDDAVVTRRLVDHAIRPLFPKDYLNETQVVLTILSLDPDADPEVTSMIAAGVAFHASDIPFNGPMVTARVGYTNGEYILNPSHEQLQDSDMDMTVSFVGEDMKFLAIESEYNNIPEDKVLSGIEFARDALKDMLKMVLEFTKEVNPTGEKHEYDSQALDEEMLSAIKDFAYDKIVEVLDLKHQEKKAEENLLRSELLDTVYEKFEGKWKKTDMERAVYAIEKKIVQEMLKKGNRPDGRAPDELRNISAKVGVLPRTHGSGLFNRGETQALTVATLGNPSLEMIVQDMYGEHTKRYMHFYNFPPFSTGEVGRISGAGGREIGHGMLAEKALRAVLPDQSEFPYTMVLQTEILSSNGSTSMASTCGSTLALMDAGVPIKDMVAGISIGLLADEEKEEYLLLTDIQGIEDFNGHMDFKITGTRTGLTAIQLDMKVCGIPMDLLPKVFDQSREARLKILDVMEATIAEPNKDLSQYAPRMATIKIDPDQIGGVIGSGGKVIKEIQAKTGTELGIEEDGTVFISGPTKEGVQQAYDIVEGMTKEIHPGEVYDGVVEEVVDFGAFVEILPGRTGLLHISELEHGYVDNVSSILNAGDTVKVKVLSVDQGTGKIALSKKALEEKPEGYQDSRPKGQRGHSGGRGGNRGGRGNDRRPRHSRR